MNIKRSLSPIFLFSAPALRAQGHTLTVIPAVPALNGGWGKRVSSARDGKLNTSL